MIVTTTPNVEGKQIVEYKQVVFGEVIAGANFMRDFFAGITDVIGGRSSVYERRISRARQDALFIFYDLFTFNIRCSGNNHFVSFNSR